MTRAPGAGARRTGLDDFRLSFAIYVNSKTASIVIYSDGPTGWKSYKGAVLAIKGGYKNVMYLRGGWAEWTAKGFPTAN